MRALRTRARRRLEASASSPFSDMLTGMIVVTGLVWALFFLFMVVTLSCAEIVALSLQGARGLPGAALLFITAFTALATLWFVDLVRARTGGPGLARRVAEAMLIGACLYSSLVHYAFLRPMTPEGRMIMAVYEGPGRIMQLGMQEVLVEQEGDFGLTPEQAEARLAFALGPPDPVWYPRQSGGGRCSCLNRRDELEAFEHRMIDWHEAEGVGDPAELTAWRDSLDPRPEAPAWCEAALAPVRYPQ